MSEMDFDRLVIVTASHGEKYAGMVPKGKDPQQYINNQVENRLPIELEDVRLFITHMQGTSNTKGQVVGVKAFSTMVCIDAFPGPMPKCHVVPVFWYVPAENETVLKVFREMVKKAEQNELLNRAGRSGIHVIPGGGVATPKPQK